MTGLRAVELLITCAYRKIGFFVHFNFWVFNFKDIIQGSDVSDDTEGGGEDSELVDVAEVTVNRVV